MEVHASEPNMVALSAIQRMLLFMHRLYAHYGDNGVEKVWRSANTKLNRMTAPGGTIYTGLLRADHESVQSPTGELHVQPTFTLQWYEVQFDMRKKLADMCTTIRGFVLDECDSRTVDPDIFSVKYVMEDE